jgi:hypothetical protein
MRRDEDGNEIGRGEFASGDEIASFFAQYGA